MIHHMTCHVTQYGGEVRRCLPRADDSAARKKTLWKTLFEGFDQIDGKPSQAEKEVHAYMCIILYVHKHTQQMHLSTCIIHERVYEV